MRSIFAFKFTLLNDEFFIGKTDELAFAEKIRSDKSIRHFSIENGTISAIGINDGAKKYFKEISTSWRAFRIDGSIDFSESGVLVSALSPISDARISALVISTFDTDIVFVKNENIDSAMAALKSAGHEISQEKGE